MPASAEASELVFELAVTGRGATGSNAHKATRRLTVRVMAAPAAPVGPAVAAVSIVSIPQAGGSYRAGEAIEVAVTFDGTVLVVTTDGTPTIELAADFEGAPGYDRGSGTDRLVFAYTVKAADADSDGIGVRENTLGLNGGTIVAGVAGVAPGRGGAACPSGRGRVLVAQGGRGDGGAGSAGCAIARRRCATSWWRRSPRRATAPQVTEDPSDGD